MVALYGADAQDATLGHIQACFLPRLTLAIGSGAAAIMQSMSCICGAAVSVGAGLCCWQHEVVI